MVWSRSRSLARVDGAGSKGFAWTGISNIVADLAAKLDNRVNKCNQNGDMRLRLRLKERLM